MMIYWPTQVVDIMRTNVEKVLERDAKLSELDDRADALQQGASQFEQQAGKLKRKFWLQNLKVCSMSILSVIIKINLPSFSLFTDDDYNGRDRTGHRWHHCK